MPAAKDASIHSIASRPLRPQSRQPTAVLHREPAESSGAWARPTCEIVPPLSPVRRRSDLAMSWLCVAKIASGHNDDRTPESAGHLRKDDEEMNGTFGDKSRSEYN